MRKYLVLWLLSSILLMNILGVYDVNDELEAGITSESNILTENGNVLDKQVESNSVQNITDEFVEEFRLRTQISKHFYNRVTDTFQYRSANNVLLPNFLRQTNWIDSEEHPIFYVLRLQNTSEYRTENITEFIELWNGFNNNSIFGVAIETFAGRFGFYLDFTDTDWGHGQYIYSPRFSNGSIPAFKKPQYALYPHLFVKAGGSWFDTILNNRTFYTGSNDPRDHLVISQTDNISSIKFITDKVVIDGFEWNITQGLKFNTSDGQFHMITHINSLDRGWQNIGFAYDITVSPSAIGTTLEPEKFILFNDTHSKMINITNLWLANETITNPLNKIDIISENGEKFSLNFDDMKNAGFNKTFLELHNQILPNEISRKTLLAGMFNFGAYTAGTEIRIDPSFSAKISNDEYDFDNTWDGALNYAVQTSSSDIDVGYNVGDLDKGYFTFDTGIIEAITSISNPILRIFQKDVNGANNIDEYIDFGLYYNSTLEGGFWNASYATLNDKANFLQETYVNDPSFLLLNSSFDDTNVTLDSSKVLTLLNAWIINHNIDPSNRQFIPFMVVNGTGMDVGSTDRMEFFDIAEGIVNRTISLTFDYTLEKAGISDFSFYKNITINSTEIFGNHTNFPLLVSLFDSDINISQADGDDIIFTNNQGLTILDYELELYNGTFNNTHAQLVAWVRIPILVNTSDTIIRMYYGNATTSNQENITGVWIDDYMGVWHFGESSGNAFDSTSFGTTGFVEGNIIQGFTGQIGNAYDFNNSLDNVDMGDPVNGHLDFGVNNFTYSIWFNINILTGNFQIPIYKGGEQGTSAGYDLEISENDANVIGGLADGTSSVTTAISSFTLNQWVNYVVVVDRLINESFLFEDAIQQGLGSDISSIGSVSTAIDLEISEFSWPVNGTLDEIRIINSSRSSDRIVTEYNNQFNPGSFISSGSQIIVDSINPIITSPADQSFEVGTTGNQISWNATDSFPDSFFILQNGTNVQNGAWTSGVLITISLDGLVVGVFNFTIQINDTSNNLASDLVTVNAISATTTGVNEAGNPGGNPDVVIIPKKPKPSLFDELFPFIMVIISIVLFFLLFMKPKKIS